VPISLDVATLIIFISENGENKSLKKSQIVCVVFVFHSLGGKNKFNRQISNRQKNQKIKIKIPVFSQLEESFGFLEKEEEQPTCASCAFTAASCRRGEHGDAEEFLAQICLFFSFLLTRCV
jgi:hypothetical protein